MPLRNQLADFSQVGAMSGASNAAATAGACHNFSLEWLSLIYKDPSDDRAVGRMMDLSKNKGGSSMVTQAVFVSEWTRQGMELADRGVSAWRGLEFVRDIISYSGYNLDNLVQALETTDIAGMLYSFWFSGSAIGAGGGAHTIAFFRKVKSSRGRTGKADNTVLAFDPNFGECWILEGNLPSWIEHMFSQYGPGTYHSLRGFKVRR
jgi:hypothetical protein